MSTAAHPTKNTRLTRSTLEHVRRNGGFVLEIPGPLVHHVRRGLHLAMTNTLLTGAEFASVMAVASRNRHAQLPAGYAGAIAHLDQLRSVLGEIGWAGATEQTPVDDLTIRLDAEEEKFGLYYEAIALAAGDGDPTPGLDSLLAAMNTCIEDAQAAHQEWLERPGAQSY
jgi:hypothetical protein